MVCRGRLCHEYAVSALLQPFIQVDKDDVELLGIGVFGGRGEYKGSISLFEGMRVSGVPLTESLVSWMSASDTVQDVSTVFFCCTSSVTCAC